MKIDFKRYYPLVLFLQGVSFNHIVLLFAVNQYLLLGFSSKCREILFSSYIDCKFYAHDKIPNTREHMVSKCRLGFLRFLPNTFLINSALPAQYLLVNFPNKENCGYFSFFLFRV